MCAAAGSDRRSGDTPAVASGNRYAPAHVLESGHGVPPVTEAEGPARSENDLNTVRPNVSGSAARHWSKILIILLRVVESG